MDSLNIVFTGKEQLELRREAVPAPKEGQILVRSLSSLISTGTEGICFTRNFVPGTNWDNWVKYPFYPGYSNIGSVVEVGPDVTDFKPGDRVACRISHRQFYLADAATAVLVPEGVSDEAATWFALGKIVQNGVRRANLQLGDNIVVIGLGLLGQLVVQYARLGGAGDIIALDRAPTRLAMAKEHGASFAVNAGVEQAKEEIAALTQGRLADVVFDVTGAWQVFQPALGLARRFGKLLLLGDSGEPGRQCISSDVLNRGVSIIGAHDVDAPPDATDYHHWNEANMVRLFFKYLSRGQIQVDDMITHRFSPADAATVYPFLQRDRDQIMGVVFDWEQL